MPSVFTKIIQGEIPSHKILEDERFLAFLEIKPINAGHTLVIPKQEIDYFFDLDDAALAGLMSFAKKVSQAIRRAIPCKRIGVMVAGLEVQHAHIHLIPILDNVRELSFANARPAQPADLAQIARSIREKI